MRLRHAVFAALLSTLALAAPAGAATTATVTGGELRVTAAPGDANDLHITYDRGTNDYIVDEQGSLSVTDGGGCAESGSDSNTARCERTGPLTIVVDAGDMDDQVVINLTGTGSTTEDPAKVDLGPGFDFAAVASGDGTAPDPADTIDGGPGKDLIQDGVPIFGGFLGNIPGDGNDTLVGGTGDDRLIASRGDDNLDGGPGDDTFWASAGADVFTGGPGTDNLDLEQGDRFGTTGDPTSVSLNDVADDGKPSQGANVKSDIEDVSGDLSADTIVGSPASNALIGRSGNDVIAGGPGSDAMSGLGGDDQFFARDGFPDAIRCGSETDTVLADTFDLVDADCENVSRPAPDTTIDSGPAAGTTTSENRPELRFSSNDPTATFECKLDDGGFAACTSPYSRLLADGRHTFEVRAVDTLGNADPTPATRAFTVGLIAGDCTNIRAIGTDSSETLNGTPAGDSILGLGGNDVVDGLQGNDCLDGDDGRDRVSGGDGNDKLTGGAGKDTLNGDDGADKLSGGADRDKLFGGGSNDTLSGGDGNDSLDGGFGTNKLKGGDGNDSIGAVNGRRDTIDCGNGSDKVRADANDRIRNCENVTVLR